MHNFIDHNHMIEHVQGLNIVINICEAIHMHLFFVNRSSALHLCFLVHNNNNIFCIRSYSLCIRLFLMQTTMDTSSIKYTSLLTKLRVELLERALKKPKIKKTFYPSEAQKQLLNICGFIDFLSCSNQIPIKFTFTNMN